MMKASQDDLDKYINEAKITLERVKNRVLNKEELLDELEFPPEIEELRWFVSPSDAAKFIIQKNFENDSISRNERQKDIDNRRFLSPNYVAIKKNLLNSKDSQEKSLNFNLSRDRLPPISPSGTFQIKLKKKDFK